MAADLDRTADGRRRIVAAIPLNGAVARRLEAMVGPGSRIVDIRKARGDEPLVLAPPASPQLLGRLRDAFPRARVVVVEVTDPEHGVRLAGPVTRIVEAGADGYVVARSLGQLAAILRDAPLDEPTAVPAELRAWSEDRLAAELDELHRRRAAAGSPGGRERRRP